MTDDPTILMDTAEAQVVVITLADGRTGSFVGPVLLTPEDGAKPRGQRVGIKAVHFGQPFLMDSQVFFVQRPDGNMAVATRTDDPGDDQPKGDPLQS